MASNHEGRRVRRPKFSTVIAFVALFAVLGGAAYAGTKINGKDIKKDTVTSKAIKNGTLKSKDLSSKATAALQGQQGPKGDTGPQGPQGPQGDPGADGVVEPLSAAAENQVLLLQDTPQNDILSVTGLTANTTYVVNAKVQVGNGSALRVDCSISRGGTEIDTALWDPAGDFSGGTLALQGVSGGAGTSITMGCEAGGGGGTATVRKITAIPVG